MSQRITRIEIDFAIPVELTRDHERFLLGMVDDVCKHNTPAGCSHWVFGHGSKPIWSNKDREFLGKPPDPAAPASGEPDFDDAVLYIETSCREK
jgi:hypothetical protein